jgi:hypothetical protein
VLDFQGVSEYLEDFLARINTPVLTTTTITFFNRVIFNIPQLFNFLSRTKAPMRPKHVHLSFGPNYAGFIVCHPGLLHNYNFRVNVWCKAYDWKISFFVQICSQLMPLLSGVEKLIIDCDEKVLSDLPDDLDHTQWLEIFRPFIAVQSLHIRHLDGLVALALQELTGESVMEVLPALRSLVVTDPDPSGSVRQVLEPFITARQLSNQPVTVEHRSASLFYR